MSPKGHQRRHARRSRHPGTVPRGDCSDILTGLVKVIFVLLKVPGYEDGNRRRGIRAKIPFVSY